MIAGAAGGAALTEVLRRVGRDFHNRLLSPMQLRRVSQGFALSLSEISARIMRGDQLRQDRFFEADGENRCTAEEILEGLLLRLADEYEGKKVEYLSHIYPQMLFEDSIPPEYSYFLVKTAGELTYRQLVFLAHFGRDGEPMPDLLPLR